MWKAGKKRQKGFWKRLVFTYTT